ncbi:FimV/HubP family polar landmark protein [Limnohabitans sp. T6-5]|uniref:FimV/HubP family polar landmark protein n=1 Tax=Limnohabitans sp. T6-5 TaxID=1100724 RepID=UPI001304EB5C|nr:FimV/HubP family polar landmark protein [Limnohabitans sp. T6-5]
MSAQAFVLGDLSVSPSQFTVFHAVLPFTQTVPVDVRDIQVQIGSAGDYERWGLTRSDAVKFIRPRVVLTSDAAGYIELVSADPVAEPSFDLVLWIAHLQQKMPVHYKVTVAEKTTLIKGDALMVPLSPVLAASAPAPRKAVQLAAVQTPAREVSVKTGGPETSAVHPDAGVSMQIPAEREAAQALELEVRKPPAPLPAPYVTVLMPHLSLTKYELLLGLVVGSSVLLLMGFLLGRYRWSQPREAMDEAESLHAHSRAEPAPKPMPRAQEGMSPQGVSDDGGVLPTVPAPVRPTMRPTLVADSTRKQRATQPRTVAEDRINLAKIYISMGDAMTARSVLDEVIAQGSEPETAQALKLIQQLV